MLMMEMGQIKLNRCVKSILLIFMMLTIYSSKPDIAVFWHNYSSEDIHE